MSELHYSVLPVPKGKRRATMSESVTAGKVSYFGLKQIDSRMIGLYRKGITLSKSITKMMAEAAGIRGAITKLTKQIDKEKKPAIIKELKANLLKQKTKLREKLAEVQRRHKEIEKLSGTKTVKEAAEKVTKSKKK